MTPVKKANRLYKSDVRDSTINALLEKAATRNYGKYLARLSLRKVRGFRGDVVSFDFPVTAVIGPNGGGKTTVLGAAACAYKTVSPRTFFAKSGNYDASMQDWAIEYELIDRGVNSKDVIRRTASFRNLRWNRDGLDRSVLIFGVSRTVPANERSEFNQCASNSFVVPVDRVDAMTSDVCAAAARILGKDITGFQRLRLDDKGNIVLLTGKTADGNSYSEFHFGAGESSIIRIVYEIEKAPDQSLILIEEIENGLHPLATRRMVEYLIEASSRKKIQVIFTTHSNEALRALPDKAILVATKNRIFQGKLDIESLRAITGQIEASLAIFVEDKFAKLWVEAILRQAQDIPMDAVQVHAMEGDGTAVALNAYHNKDPASTVPSICVIDGDSKQQESIKEEVYRLPGEMPEALVFDQTLEKWDRIGGKLAVALFQRYENADRVKDVAIDIRRTCLDGHLLFAQLGERLGLVPQETVAAAFANIDPPPERVPELM